MKKNLISCLLFFIFFSSCGFKPIFSSKNSDFSINEITFVKKNKINTKIEKKFYSFSDLKNKKRFFELNIDASKQIVTLSKDSKGNELKFEMTVRMDVNFLENNQEISTKKYIESFSYNNISNKFDLSQYEKNIEENLIKKIVQEITEKLYSF